MSVTQRIGGARVPRYGRWMNRRFVLIAAPLALLLLGAAPARKAPPPAPLPDHVTVVLTTELGQITLELDHKHAPITVENFVHYVDTKRFDGMVFYRAMRLAWGTPPNGLVQAGVQNDPRKLFKPIAHESTLKTGLSHTAGALSMARLAPGTATADFSIMLSDLTGLDADPKAADPDAREGYAVFGRVSGRMDVVRKIFDAPVSATKGVGAMKGQMIEKPVKVLTARRIAAPGCSLIKPAAVACGS